MTSEHQTLSELRHSNLGSLNRDEQMDEIIRCLGFQRTTQTLGIDTTRNAEYGQVYLVRNSSEVNENLPTSLQEAVNGLDSGKWIKPLAFEFES